LTACDLLQKFWVRWKEEYLSLPQQRSKWRTSGPALTVNDVVLVKDENLPSMKWPLTRIVKLVPGRDAVGQVEAIRTSSETTKRAVSKLCLLRLKDKVGSQAQLKAECRDKMKCYCSVLVTNIGFIIWSGLRIVVEKSIFFFLIIWPI